MPKRQPPTTDEQRLAEKLGIKVTHEAMHKTARVTNEVPKDGEGTDEATVCPACGRTLNPIVTDDDQIPT